MRWLSRLWLTVAIAAGFATCSVKATETEEVERYLFASVHRFASFHAKQGRTNFHDETEQGVFVYDINDGHKLVEKSPAKWSHFRNAYRVRRRLPAVVRHGLFVAHLAAS